MAAGDSERLAKTTSLALCLRFLMALAGASLYLLRLQELKKPADFFPMFWKLPEYTIRIGVYNVARSGSVQYSACRVASEQSSMGHMLY